jgi:hypothetical protein
VYGTLSVVVDVMMVGIMVVIHEVKVVPGSVIVVGM